MAEVTEQVTDAAEGAAESVGGGGGAAKIVVPLVLAGGTAAAYMAGTRTGKIPKVSDLRQKASDATVGKIVDTAESLGQSALGAAEDKGGVTGFAAGLVKKKGEGGGLMGGIGDAVKKLNPFGGKGKEPSEGWGKGRRNPIQITADVGVPLDVAYDQWTQFEEFPKFMHRVTSVTQESDDPTKLKWQEKIWFFKREWEAQVVDQWPDERIGWRTASGTRHVGHVTFTELGPNLTRIVVNLDFSPSGVKEKMASGLRFVKRAAKSDVYRYKAFIETHKEATGTWRGRIEDGEVVEDAEPEEGKPFEEGQELRKPGPKGDKKKKGDEKKDDAKDEKQGDDEKGDDGDGDAEDEVATKREERARQREERRAAREAAQ